MKWPLYTQVALLKDVPEEGLSAGDAVTTVDFLESPKPGVPNGYFVEAFNALGKTIAVFIVYEDDIQALTEYDVLSRRTLEAAQVRTIDQQNSWPIWGLNQPDGTPKEDAALSVIDLNLPPEKTSEPSIPLVDSLEKSVNGLLESLVGQGSVTREDAKLEVALFLFQREWYSLGKASALAGLHTLQFQQELANRNISVHYDRSDYEQDMRILETGSISQLVHHQHAP